MLMERRPKGYKPPTWKEVEPLLAQLRADRQVRIDKIRELKKARRDQWESVLAQIPSAYRRMAPVMGFPDLAEMGQRITGLIAQHEPVVEVVPPSPRPEDIRKAAGEEARLWSTRISVQDQQDRNTYMMGIDAQVNWGESWISVLPDSSRIMMPDACDCSKCKQGCEGFCSRSCKCDGDCCDDEKEAAVAEAESILGFKRGRNEDPDKYMKRYQKLMLEGCLPLIFEDHDPQTVRAVMSRGRLRVVIVESEHEMYKIQLGLGYKPMKGEDEKVDWVKGDYTLGPALVVGEDDAGTPTVVDTTHDSGPTGTSRPGSKKVKRVIYFDQWTVMTFLDGVMVEKWEHNWGVVPVFPAFGEQTSDQEPGQETRAVIEGALVLARQVVLWSAMLTSNAKLHGFPTPFLKNPESGVSWNENVPRVRAVRLGEMNFLGPNEEIVFPYLDATMGQDFFKNMEFLMGRLEGLTLQSWGSKLSPETSGYAVAQIRALQHSILGPVYTNAATQWRKIHEFIRFLVKSVFKAGLWLRGAVEVEEVEGTEYEFSPIMKYGPEDVTDFTINIRIDEGVVQDELALRKSAIELKQAGIWSTRRAREETGVEDAVREGQEVDLERLLNSEAMDMQVLQLAMARAAERLEASRTDLSTPFMQALQNAKAKMFGGNVPGSPGPSGAGAPVNALPGGQPQQQNPAPAAPQQGGPAVGPSGPPIEQLGAAGLPGGVEGGQPMMVP